MIESRRWPNATPVFWSTHTPSASGPRWLKTGRHASSDQRELFTGFAAGSVEKTCDAAHSFFCLRLRVCGASYFFGVPKIRMRLFDSLVQNVFAFVAEVRDREIFQDSLARAQVERFSRR